LLDSAVRLIIPAERSPMPFPVRVTTFYVAFMFLQLAVLSFGYLFLNHGISMKPAGIVSSEF
jgi:hypothetical protein